MGSMKDQALSDEAGISLHKLGRFDWVEHFEDFLYPATAQVPGWWNPTTGGTGTSGIAATLVHGGAYTLTADANNDVGSVRMENNAPKALACFDFDKLTNIRKPARIWKRFRLSRFADSILRVGLFKDANEYAYLEYDSSLATTFYFKSHDGVAAVSYDTGIIPALSKWYLLRLDCRKNSAGEYLVAPFLKSAEANFDWRGIGGAHKVSGHDDNVPFFYLKALAATTHAADLDLVWITAPRQ